jgi:NitT/TauT family transport system ATP-binding protein
MAQAYIEVENLSVVYRGSTGDSIEALRDVSFGVSKGAFISIVGPSGCGKSTLLKAVGDILTPTRGIVRIDGQPARTVRQEGRVGFVFQQDSLLPWLNIEDNILLLWRLVFSRRGRKDSTNPDLKNLIEIVGLQGFGHKYPHQLSSGMQQRVALARALALNPALLLMDEPFGALDQITRDRMGLELMRIWTWHRKTVLFVTHSLSEAVFLSDQIILSTPRPGRVQKIFDVDLPRPRDPELRLSQPFLILVEQISRELNSMMLETSMPKGRG